MKQLLKTCIVGLVLSFVCVPSSMAGESPIYNQAGDKFSDVVISSISKKYGKWHGEIAYDPATDGFFIHTYEITDKKYYKILSILFIKSTKITTAR